MSVETNFQKKISKTVFICKTIEMMKEPFKDDPVIKNSLTSILDSVAHTAPEIVQNRWNDIYMFAIKYITDENNIFNV